MVRFRCIRTCTPRINSVIFHVTGVNIDDGKKDRRRKEIVGRLGKEMNDRRDECVSLFASSLSHVCSNKVASVFPVGANTRNRSPHCTAWPCNSRHAQKRFRHIRFACTHSPSSARHCSRSWRWKSGILSRVQRRPTSLSANALKRNGSAVGIGYASGSSRASRSGGGEREMKRMERGLSVVRSAFFLSLSLSLFLSLSLCVGRDGASLKCCWVLLLEAALDSQSRPHITRKLRNRLGTSPPPTPLVAHPNGVPNGMGPTPPGPVTNPHSLSVDELPSPFPLPLTATSLPNMAAGNVGSNGSRRRPKGGGFQVQAVGGLGKSGASLTGCKESEIDSDLGEIRRGNKRRRGGPVSIIKP